MGGGGSAFGRGCPENWLDSTSPVVAKFLWILVLFVYVRNVVGESVGWRYLINVCVVLHFVSNIFRLSQYVEESIVGPYKKCA